ncbi:hypothetical protein JZO85_00665 [Enterococcus sp. MJM16]|uniref:T4 recombination endonuclease VII dimerisation domain-containing protein n=1 Tax=Candidatus Enterococcus murrayae TaxID=2815321 RepID=A0ABS3HBC3_9ENTE|nr:hypothetical protein [Enterococcus sp. MJM16]
MTVLLSWIFQNLELLKSLKLLQHPNEPAKKVAGFSMAMTADEMRNELDIKGVEYKSTDTKPKLLEKLLEGDSNEA